MSGEPNDAPTPKAIRFTKRRFSLVEAAEIDATFKFQPLLLLHRVTGTPLVPVHLAARASRLTPLHPIRLGLSI
jgi:hypothetical protein